MPRLERDAETKIGPTFHARIPRITVVRLRKLPQTININIYLLFLMVKSINQFQINLRELLVYDRNPGDARVKGRSDLGSRVALKPDQTGSNRGKSRELLDRTFLYMN